MKVAIISETRENYFNKLIEAFKKIDIDTQFIEMKSFTLYVKDRKPTSFFQYRNSLNKSG